MQHKEPSPIRREDTLGDHDYRSYEDSRTEEIRVPVWKLKQGNTFSTFSSCQKWLMGTFPPTEILHQKKQKHKQLYQSHVVVQANQVSTYN
ncbi:hypothetical protein Hanom_Chr08g00745141 [Helianthus anomalus]